MPHHHYILLADDSDADALLTQMRLKNARLDHSMHRVPDGAQAIAYLNGQNEYADRSKFPFPSVLLLDLHMPNMDGFEVLHWLSRQPAFRRLLVVVISNASEEEMILRVYQAGAHAFFSKACTSEEFRRLVTFLESFFAAAWSGHFVATGTHPPEQRMRAQ